MLWHGIRYCLIDPWTCRSRVFHNPGAKRDDDSRKPETRKQTLTFEVLPLKKGHTGASVLFWCPESLASMAEDLRPPDPRQNPECHEVNHKEVFELRQVRDMYVLRNVQTNEAHSFSFKVRLHFREERAYISDSLRQTTWCSQLMCWSVWAGGDSLQGRRFVCRLHSDAELERCWLSDFQMQKKLFYIDKAGFRV